MTEEQWHYLNAQISSLRAMTIALAQSLPNQAELKANFSSQSEYAVSSLLGTTAQEAYIDRLRLELDRLEQLLWG